MSSATFVLSVHSDYRCRHTGACCSADWDVPVELPVYRTLREAMDGLRPQLSGAVAQMDPFIVEPDLPGGAAAMLERTEAGECMFLEPQSRLCVIHRELGEPALPSTCRFFPRLALRDRRGTFITLSHFCPTAASMLFREDCALAIVEQPPAFPPGDYEGLVVSDEELPPLLTPSMLMDLESFSAWERHMIDRCAEVERAPESVLATLQRDAGLLRLWRPGRRALVDEVAALPSDFVDQVPDESIDSSLKMFDQVIEAVPDDLKPEPDDHGLDASFADFVRPAWRRLSAPINRYLGAKAFASWTAYQGRGIATIVRGLEAALAVVRVEAARQCRNAEQRLDNTLLHEAIRRADFVLNHLAVAEELASRWSSAED